MKKEREYVGLATRFVGIKLAAKELGVNENHLRFVLKGKRESLSLTARVRAKYPALLGLRPKMAAPSGGVKS